MAGWQTLIARFMQDAQTVQQQAMAQIPGLVDQLTRLMATAQPK